MLFKHLSLIVSVAALTLVASAISASAEITNSGDPANIASSVQDSATAIAPITPEVASSVGNIDLATESTNTQSQASSSSLSKVEPTPATVAASQPIKLAHHHKTEQVLQAQAQTTDISVNAKPVPGTVATTAAALQGNAINSQTSNTTSATPVSQDTKIAQTDIDPGRATRAGSSYLGVAGNIGFGGDSALGSSNFAVMSKIGLTRNFAVRPAAVFGDETVILVPLTYEFPLRGATDPIEPARYAPYIGGGVAINTGDDSTVGFLATAGLDIPISREFTANAALNANFKDETDFGLLLGIGYNFSGL